jgi:hypothetical protein
MQQQQQLQLQQQHPAKQQPKFNLQQQQQYHNHHPSFWPCSDSHRKCFVAAGFPTDAALLVLSSLSSHHFLIDSGLSKSVIPHHSSLPPTDPTLYTADDKPIATWVFRRLPVQFGDRKFHFPFVLAAVSTPIIGHDFLHSHHLLVDPAHHRLIDSRNSTIIFDSASSTTAAISNIPSPVQQLLNSYPTTLGTESVPLTFMLTILHRVFIAPLTHIHALSLLMLAA